MVMAIWTQFLPQERSVYLNYQGGLQGGQKGMFTESGRRLGRGHGQAVFLAVLGTDDNPDALVAGKSQASLWRRVRQGGFSDTCQGMRFIERYGLAVGEFNEDSHLDVHAASADSVMKWKRV